VSLPTDNLRREGEEELSIEPMNITETDILKPFQTPYLNKHICLTQLSTLVDTPLGATTDFEHY
jgi:hypothetical protein